MERPVFLYDIGSPWSWLAAERLHAVLGEVPEWQPALVPPEEVDREAVEAAARALPGSRHRSMGTRLRRTCGEVLEGLSPTG